MFLNRTRSATVVWTLAGEYDAAACSCVVDWMSYATHDVRRAGGADAVVGRAD